MRIRTLFQIALVAVVLDPAEQGGTTASAGQTRPSTHGPDLTVVQVDLSGLRGDWQTLTVTGSLTARIRNQGDLAAENSFDTLFFEDLDGDHAYDGTIDRALGSVATPGLTALTEGTVTLPLASSVLFRDNLVFASVDSGGSVAEFSERDNIRHSGEDCVLNDGNRTAAADLTASRLGIDAAAHPGSVRITARVGNGGSREVAAGYPVSFYDVDASAGDLPVASASTSMPLAPGQYEDVVATWTSPPREAGQLAAVVGNASGAGFDPECRRDNNRHMVRYEFVERPPDPAAPSPVLLPHLAQGRDGVRPRPTDEPSRRSGRNAKAPRTKHPATLSIRRLAPYVEADR